ncbi:hypothetical protein Ga0466249_001744 [Sporomusaceae bacterium BoRhaA]|nr:hypothetical protein [Pelorhabdus rhamnosifermentans]
MVSIIRWGVGSEVALEHVIESVSVVDPLPVEVVFVVVEVFEVAEVLGGEQSAITWPPHFAFKS